MRNLANILTFTRVILTLIINIGILLKTDKHFVILVLILIVLFTDFFDGRIARKRNTSTIFGEMIDVSADFFYIILSAIVLNYFDILPISLLLCIIFEFFLFLATSVKINSKQGKLLVFDHFGRIMAIIYYILPGVIYITYVFNINMYQQWIDKIEYSVVIGTCFLVIYRILLLTKDTMSIKMTKDS